jgi:hypothetical protein
MSTHPRGCCSTFENGLRSEVCAPEYFQSTRPKMNIGKLRYKAAHSVEASTEYQQHVEVSEIEHLETVQQMQKKQSLYDYGSHGPS